MIGFARSVGSIRAILIRLTDPCIRQREGGFISSPLPLPFLGLLMIEAANR